MSGYNPVVELNLYEPLEQNAEAELAYLERKLSELVRAHPRRSNFTDAGLLSLIAVVAVRIAQRRSREAHHHIAALVEHELCEGRGRHGFADEDESLDYRVATFLKGAGRLHQLNGPNPGIEVLKKVARQLKDDGHSNDEIIMATIEEVVKD